MVQKRSPERPAFRAVLQGLFGQKLQHARRSASKKPLQEELATALGVSRTTVSNIERGRHRIFLDQVYIAAKELGVPVTDLLPAPDDVFTQPPLNTAPDVSINPKAAQAIAEVARTVVSEQLASKTKGSATRRN